MECEVELHNFILKNKPFAENQVVRCLKVDELINRPGKFFKQKNRWVNTISDTKEQLERIALCMTGDDTNILWKGLKDDDKNMVINPTVILMTYFPLSSLFHDKLIRLIKCV